MSLLCKLGKHKHVLRHSIIVDTTNWAKYNMKTGEELPHTEYKKDRRIVMYQCERRNCDHRVAFMETHIRSGANDGAIESKTSIHIDLANEKIFAEKL